LRRSTVLIWAFAGLLVGTVAALALLPSVRERVLPVVNSVGTASVGGPFSLVDQTGRTVTDRDFRGRYMLVYFGFTHCPDVCPAALQVMQAALDKVGAKAKSVAPVFITVDPERDTPEVLADYLSSFPGTTGLTGSPEAVRAAATAYRVYYRKMKDEGSSADYTVDHTSIIYLMGPDGAFLAHFTHATPVDTIAAKLASQL
jgi:protein SCO1/2